MIIKKPYAFLIRHFRLVHVVLTALLLYILGTTGDIFTFFNDYVKNGYYAYSPNLASEYINFYMFLAIVFVLVFSTFVYLLMKWKEKSRLFYVSICLFYFVIFVGLLFYFNLFNSLLNTTLDVRTVRIYRDIILLMYAPQYFFLIYSIIRAIGFDIKKFDFKKDMEELDIAEEDQEEIEVTFGQNAYKYKRKARRTFREFKYYVLENKFFFGMICGILTLVLGFVIYVNVSVYDKEYYESDYFDVNGVIFRVLESYVSPYDLRGNVINEKYKYVVVKVSMENMNTIRSTLETKDLRLMIDDEIFKPTFSKNEYFKDFGEGYYKNILYPSELNEYLFIFEIPADLDTDGALFRMVDGVSTLKGEISAKYKDVVLDLKDYLDKNDFSSYNVGDVISLEKSTMKETEILVNSYSLGDEFIEVYEYCVDKCYMGKKVIKPDTIGVRDRTILKLDIDVDLEKDMYINKFLTNNSMFVNTFGSISYLSSEGEKQALFSVKNLDIDTDNVYLEVPSEIKNAYIVRLIFNIRNESYVINLR